MKKLISLMLVALLVVSLLPVSAFAAVTWGYDGKGTLTLSGSGAMTDYSAASPAPWAEYANAITKVYIHSGVTSIGSDAFAGMNSLRSVTIPSSVTTIGEFAFYRCDSLSAVTLPSALTSVGDYAFYGCDALTTVSIPATVTTIGESAFAECSKLSSLTIGSGVTKISSYAFFDCDSLVNVTIPASVTTMGTRPFEDCDSLAGFTVASGNTAFATDSTGTLYTADMTTLIRVPNVHSGSFTVPSTVTTIKPYAFFGCESITDIQIPASVTSVSKETFGHCASLERIQVAADNASFCNDETGVLYNKDKTCLYRAPEKMTGSYVIPETVSTISTHAFDGCVGLAEVTMNETATAVPESIFEGCTGLKKVTFTGNAPTIHDEAFWGVTADVYYSQYLDWTESHFANYGGTLNWVSAHTHEYTATRYEATCKEYARIEYICEGCGHSYVDYTGAAMSEWMEKLPEGLGESVAVETKEQYRFSTQNTITSYAPVIDGFTQIGSTWVVTENGSVDYVLDWPTGFDKTSSIYTKYNNQSNKITATETDAVKTTITSDGPYGYLWYHWCDGSSSTVKSYETGTYTTFHAFYSETMDYMDYDVDNDSYQILESGCCANGEWFWFVEVYKQEYTTSRKQYTHEGWSDWSQWSDTVATASDTQKVETRTLYRYLTSELASHTYVDGVCTVCGVACDHTWNKGTCSSCGMGCTHLWSNGVCTNCGMTCAHAWSNGTCTTCGAVCDHAWNNGTCTVCGMACAHSWNNGSCATCGKLCAHSWISGACTACGMTCTHTYVDGVCSTCGTACVHSWNNGVCTNCGFNCFHMWGGGACTICGKACDHTWIDGTCGTCGQVCSHTYVNGTCSTCGKTEAVVTLPTLTPVLPSVALEEEVKYNIYFTATDLGTCTVDDMGLAVFKNKDANGTVATADDVIPGAVRSGSYYKVQSNGIAAKNMGDALYFRIYVKLADGSYVYSKVITFNAVSYVKSVLAASSYEAGLKQTCIALMNYGASAQIYFGYKTESLMNSFITDEQQATVADYAATMISPIAKADSSKTGAFAATSGGYTSRIPSLSLEGAFAINYYFEPAKTVEGSMTFYYWDKETYDTVDVLTKENALGVKTMSINEDGEYWASFDGIAAKELDDTVYVAAVYESGGVTYSTGVLAVSITVLCGTHMGSNANLTALAQSIVVYGNQAKSYFGS